MNNIILFIIGKLKGYHPICDRCLDVDKKSTRLGFLDYILHSKGDYIYCVSCWNWIHLKHGTCKCGTYVTHRDKWGVKTKTCPTCNRLIELVVKI